MNLEFSTVCSGGLDVNLGVDLGMSLDISLGQSLKHGE